MTKISTVVLTKNSEKTLARCLKSLAWSDEIIIIDDYSTDKTIRIAKEYKARVFKRKLNGNFAAQRNFGLTKARNDWVFFLDSDETINKKINIQPGFDGLYIKRLDNWMGKKIGFGETNSLFLRLAKKKSGRWVRKVHEIWDVSGNVGVLKNIINHYPHPTVAEFINEISVYSVIHSRENKKSGKNSGIGKILFFPFLKFVNNFVIKSGFRDGTHGFVIAMLMSFHSFLAWSNLWLTSKKNY